jgi:hypothetical protein
MTIRLRYNGRVIDNARWFGFNFWARAWTAEGWLHLAPGEFDVIAH